MVGGRKGATIGADLHARGHYVKSSLCAGYPPRAHYLDQAERRGTTMGSPPEFAALPRATETGLWVPVVDSVRPLAAASAAHAHMEPGEQFGKLVLAV